MMYQRDMCRYLLKLLTPPDPLPQAGQGQLAEQAEQKFDERREERVDAEEEEGEQLVMITTMIAGRDGFLAGRPVDLGGLGADLTDEFAGGSTLATLPCSSFG